PGGPPRQGSRTSEARHRRHSPPDRTEPVPHAIQVSGAPRAPPGVGPHGANLPNPLVSSRHPPRASSTRLRLRQPRPAWDHAPPAGALDPLPGHHSPDSADRPRFAANSSGVVAGPTL